MSSWVGSPRSGFYLRELIRGVGDEHARLADGPVAHDDALDRLGSSIHGERYCAIDARIAVTVVSPLLLSLLPSITISSLPVTAAASLSHGLSIPIFCALLTGYFTLHSRTSSRFHDCLSESPRHSLVWLESPPY